MDILNFLWGGFSFLADLSGILGLFLTAKTYSKMKKLKSSDDRVSFRLKKDDVLKGFCNNLEIIKGYSTTTNIKFTDLQPIIQAMEDVLASIKSLEQHDIWVATARKSFSDIIETDIQIKKMKAEAHTDPQELYTGYTPEEISTFFNDFSVQLEEIIHIVENQT